jgi:hypothetical protein
MASNFLPQEANPISYKLFHSPAPQTIIHLNNKHPSKSGIPSDLLTPLVLPPQIFQQEIFQKPNPKTSPIPIPQWP